MLEDVIKVVRKLESEGLVERWAIGGAVGFITHVGAFDTEDLDIFVVFPATKGLLVSLTPLL